MYKIIKMTKSRDKFKSRWDKMVINQILMKKAEYKKRNRSFYQEKTLLNLLERNSV
jgi:hypothetical protein